MKLDIRLNIDPAAVAELKKATEAGGADGSLVRVISSGGGCGGSSFGLVLIPESDVNEEVDVVEDFDGLRLVVDRKCLLMLDGTTIEWVQEPRSGFKFSGPAQKTSCGCRKNGCG